MHRLVPAAAILLMSMFLVVPFASAVGYVVDGDVSDWGINLNEATYDGYLNTVTPASPSAEYIREDSVGSGGYVEPGYGGQAFDIEAMYFDSDSVYGYLAIITGFPLAGAQSFGPGDLGIDVSSATASVIGDSSQTTVYEFGIDLDNSKLYSVLTWQGVYYDSNPSPDYASTSDPWIIHTTTGEANGVNFVYSNNAINSHYVYEFSFLLSDLGIAYGDAINFHWTMECGNDYLDLPATVNHAPEPTSMLLLGTGLIGISAVSRRKFDK